MPSEDRRKSTCHEIDGGPSRLSDRRRIALDFLVEAMEESSPLDNLVAEAFGECLYALGMDVVAELLAAGAGLDEAGGRWVGDEQGLLAMIPPGVTSDPPPWRTGEPFKLFLLRALPPPADPIESLLADIGWRLELAVAGPSLVDARVPAAIYATELGDTLEAGWRFDFDQSLPLSSAGPVAILVEIPDPAGAAATVPAGVVELVQVAQDHVEVQIHVDRFPPGDSWHVFGVSTKPELNRHALKAIFLLRRRKPEYTPGSHAGPSELTRAGYLYGAWKTALDEGWSDMRLKALLALIFAKMGDTIDRFLEAKPERADAAKRFPFNLLRDSVNQEIKPRFQAMRLALGPQAVP